MSSLFESDFFSDAAWSVLVSQHGETSTVTIEAISDGTIHTPGSAIFQDGRVLDPSAINDARVNPDAYGVLVLKPSTVSAWTPAQSDIVHIGTTRYLVESVGKTEPLLEIQLTTSPS